MADWWEDFEAEWWIAHRVEQPALNPAMPETLHDALTASLGREAKFDVVHRVWLEESPFPRFLLVASRLARLVHVRGRRGEETDAAEVRFLGALDGGLYTDIVWGTRDRRERDMAFEHERIPGGTIRAQERRLPPNSDREFARDGRKRTAALREQLIAWSDARHPAG